MQLHSTRRIFKIFLASPSDVAPERQATDQVVTELNKILAPRTGWQIELHKWEDTTPGFGRAQSLINPQVEGCDLFLGILWERWGQPTGGYTSGFDEEYQLALKRRRATGRPEIWLAFKAPRRAKRSDPGPELAKVLDFQRRQEPEVLYKIFKDAQDWKTQLTSWLIAHILDLPPEPDISKQLQIPESTPSTNPGANAVAEPPKVETQRAPAPAQLIKIARLLVQVVESGELEFPPSKEHLLTQFDIARLYLASATWMSRRYTQGVLGTHEANLLYKHREELRPTPLERTLLLRSTLSGADVTPGWYWSPTAAANSISSVLLFYAANDSLDYLRQHAIQLLRLSNIQLQKNQWPLLPFRDSSEAVRAEAFDYLGQVGNREALGILEEFAVHGDSSTVGLARKARLTLISRVNPSEALTIFLEHPGLVSEELLQNIVSKADELPIDLLKNALPSPNEKLREFATEQLAKRGELSSEMAEKLTEDPITNIKFLAFEELSRRGVRIEFEKFNKAFPNVSPWGREAERITSIMFEDFRSVPTESLLQQTEWLRADGYRVYRFLATYRFDAVKESIRTDIEAGFTSVRVKFLENVKAQYGEEAMQRIDKGIRELDGFIRSRYLGAALEGLVVNGEISDISIARQYLSHEYPHVRTPALKLLTRFADARDIGALLKLAHDPWPEIVEIAVNTALRLSSNPFEIATNFVKNGSGMPAKLSFRWLFNSDDNVTMEFFKGLLNDKNDHSRERAVCYLMQRLNDQELTSLLERYLREKSYYYNVVTWLDRLLYAPSLLKEMYRKQLLKSANG